MVQPNHVVAHGINSHATDKPAAENIACSVHTDRQECCTLLPLRIVISWLRNSQVTSRILPIGSLFEHHRALSSVDPDTAV